MKWNELSVLKKVIFVITGISGLGMLVALLCTILGVHDLRDQPLYYVFQGTVWLGLAILNWEKQRGVAIAWLVLALLNYVVYFF